MTPATEPLTARRNARFVEEWHFIEAGLPFDFTSYTDAALQVRLYGAQPGSALISLGKVTTDTEGVWIIEPSAGIIRVRIGQPTLKAVFDALIGDNEAGSKIPLLYDLRLTGPDGATEVWLEGPFIIEPGVTISG